MELGIGSSSYPPALLPLLPDSAPSRGARCPQGLLWQMAITMWLLEKKSSEPSPIWSCWCPALLCPGAAGMFEVEGHRSQQGECPLAWEL